MNESTRLLVIDNGKKLPGLIETLQREGIYRVFVADTENPGIELAKEKLPHLIICDLTIPQPEGRAILAALSENSATAAIPFLFFITTRTDEQEKGNGANEHYIIKPFSKEELLARIETILEKNNAHEKERERLANTESLNVLSIKIYELLQLYSTDFDGLAKALCQILALRDNETEDHAHRVVELSVKLAQEIDMEKNLIHHIRLGALLHDIGKVGIPDSILLKNGTLTDEEREIMAQHPNIGKRILQPLRLPPTVIDLVQHHHEHWDGSGYPNRLVGKRISIPARIFAIVDTWDALNSDRPYRKAWSRDNAIIYMKKQAGKYFDPDLVEKFLGIV
jgi:putative two-component system response regulator